MHHYYETKINYNLQSNYIILVLYNMLEHPRYHLGVVVPAGNYWHICRGNDLANNSYCS